jgi:hypothetical protein
VPTAKLPTLNIRDNGLTDELGATCLSDALHEEWQLKIYCVTHK